MHSTLINLDLRVRNKSDIKSRLSFSPMKSSPLKQQKPLASDTPFNEQANPPTDSRSFKKVIFGELALPSSYWEKKKQSKDKIKLFRYRVGTATEAILSLARSPQSKKSLKTVKTIDLTPQRSLYCLERSALRPLRLTKLTRCSTFILPMNIYANPESPIALFSKLWPGALKELRKYDVKRLKIEVNAEFMPSWRMKVRGALNWWQYTFRLLQFLKNLRCLNFQKRWGRDTQFKDDHSRMCNYAHRIKHLSKMKRIVLGGVDSFINDPVPFYKCFLAPPAFEHVEIINNNPELSQPIAECLIELKNLKQFIFRGDFEIADVLSVIQAHPTLYLVNALGKWSHDNENISIDTLTQGLQLQNITHLYLDSYLPITSKEDCKFYRKFMGTFTNLESLRIGFNTIKKMDFAGEYADILIPLKKITRLELGLSLTLENMAKFFTQIPSLTTLKHFIFAADIQVPRTVAKQLPQAIEPLRKFLLSLENLEFFEVHCHKVGLIFLQGMCQVMLALQKTQSITLSFETNSDNYLPVHDTMMKEIQNTAEALTNTQEFYVTMITGGSWNFKMPKELDECQNENLKKYKFTLGGRWKLPSYGTRWF